LESLKPVTFHQEEDRTKLGRRLSQEAIALAVQGRWEEAIAANKAILERFADDVAAFNRLGRAYIELGLFPDARDAYERALAIDPGNSIASKNRERLKSWSAIDRLAPDKARPLGRDFFSSTVGKTGVVALTNIAHLDRIVAIGVGGSVKLVRHGQQVVAASEDGEVLGELDPKHGARLAKLMHGGNEYSATVLATGESGTQLLVREDYQHPSQAGRQSFPPTQADKLYGHPGRVNPVETPPIVDEGRKSLVSSHGMGDSDFEETYADDDDKGYYEGFTMVEEPEEREGSIE
jgi:tetratricopeptide (TPR) repeat protein